MFQTAFHALRNERDKNCSPYVVFARNITTLMSPIDLSLTPLASLADDNSH